MPIQTENGLMLIYEDYVKIPEEGRRHEIIDGRHIVNAAPRLRHQIIVYRIGLALQTLFHSGRAEIVPSPLDLQLTDSDIVQPDIVAVSSSSGQRVSGVWDLGHIPDLPICGGLDGSACLYPVKASAIWCNTRLAQRKRWHVPMVPRFGT